jgi:Zn-dependent protease/CBS domain-containing protein
MKGLLNNGGIKVGKLFGIKIYIDSSWFFIFAIVTWNLATGVFAGLRPDWDPTMNWSIGIVASLLFFASVLAHELAHSLVAKSFGLPINRIVLFLFGGVANIEKEPSRPKIEFAMAIAGPLTSIVIGIVAILAGSWGRIELDQLVNNPLNVISALTPLETLLAWLGVVNIMVGLFNLLPGFPLDGGRILRSIIWFLSDNLKLATGISATFGRFIGFIFMFIGISMMFGVNVPFFGSGFGNGLWLGFIGWFLQNASKESYSQLLIKDLLKGLPVDTLVRSDIKSVDPGIYITEFIDNYMIGSNANSFPVTSNGKLKGLVSMSDLQKEGKENWSRKRVAEVMKPKVDVPTINIDDTDPEAIVKIATNDLGETPVVKGKDKLVGMLSRRDVFLWISLNKNTNGSLKEI